MLISSCFGATKYFFLHDSHSWALLFLSLCSLASMSPQSSSHLSSIASLSCQLEGWSLKWPWLCLFCCVGLSAPLQNNYPFLLPCPPFLFLLFLSSSVFWGFFQTRGGQSSTLWQLTFSVLVKWNPFIKALFTWLPMSSVLIILYALYWLILLQILNTLFPRLLVWHSC